MRRDAIPVEHCVCAERKKPAGSARVATTIIGARKALGDGLPQVAAVKATPALEPKGLYNLDVIKCADWLIDLGPGGGTAGGRIVATGTPENVCGNPDSVTGRFLAGHLRGRDAARGET